MEYLYAVIDKSNGKTKSMHQDKMQAKEARNKLQAETKKGVPQAPKKEGEADPRAEASNWSYTVKLTVNVE